MTHLEQFLRKRDAVFRNLTLETATMHWKACGCPPPVAPDVPLGALHKARLQWLDATDEMLAESKKWLMGHGYGADMQGAPPLTPEQRDAYRKTLGKKPLR